MSGRARPRLYWIVIALLAVAMAVLYAAHLATGRTPDRVLFTVPGVDLPVFWYGVIIMGGIMLGATVAADLAQDRARAVFAATVPAALRRRPLADLNLPDETASRLARLRLATVGDLLFAWGLDVQALGLSAESRTTTQNALLALPESDPAWLTDAPWRQWDPDHIWNGLLWVLILGIIGARIYHVLTPSPSMARIGIESPLDYLRNPMELINLRNGGLGIYGAIIGGALGIIAYAWRRRIAWLNLADLSVVGMALGQWVGRWGNYFNQELYGAPTTLPWAVTIERPLGDWPPGTRFHPAFLYESLWNGLAFLVLFQLARRGKLLQGELTGLYLVLYGFGRILLELVRLDSRTLGTTGIPVASAVAGVTIALVAALMVGRRLRRRA